MIRNVRWEVGGKNAPCTYLLSKSTHLFIGPRASILPTMSEHVCAIDLIMEQCGKCCCINVPALCTLYAPSNAIMSNNCFVRSKSLVWWNIFVLTSKASFFLTFAAHASNKRQYPIHKWDFQWNKQGYWSLVSWLLWHYPHRCIHQIYQPKILMLSDWYMT